jgi:hypothetical protein
MDLKIKVANYLKERFDPGAELISMDYVGKGLHGVAYQITYSVSGETKKSS